MCPICIATATQVILGAASAGVWTPRLIEKLRLKVKTSSFSIKIVRRTDHE
jgi:hypothetical protein